MASFKILTDSCCDFPGSHYSSLDLGVVPLSLDFRGQIQDDRNDHTLKTLYDGLRSGETATTSAINPDRWSRAMEPVLQEGFDLLVIAFSSGLSTTYQSAEISAGELRERYPQRRILVVDSLCASMGQGLLVYYACQKRDAGLSLEETHRWVEDHKRNICHWFTVDDLMYLKRGGRVSATTALLGTMLQIKPVLHVDDQGHLVSVGKARGRKASIDAMAKKLEELGKNRNNDTVFLSHGDCAQDADYLASVLKEKYGVKNVFVSYVGSVIGSHAGPGVLALFFLGDHR